MLKTAEAADAIILRDIRKIYGTGEGQVHALDGVSLTIKRGEFVTIAGQSGSGKSTLMNILGCLDTPTSGDYQLWGMKVSHLPEKRLSHIRNREIGFVFQGFNLIPGLTARENVELPLRYRGMRPSQRKKAGGGGSGAGRAFLPDGTQARADERWPAAEGSHRKGHCRTSAGNFSG